MYLLNTICYRKVIPSVKPGYIDDLVPNEAPEKGEQWQDLFKDIETVVTPGMTHWHSPNFHSYYPTAQSYASILGDLLSFGFGCIGFSWVCFLFKKY